MNARTRALLLTVAAIIVLPVTTAHALLSVLTAHEHGNSAAWLHPEILPVAGLTLLSAIPLLGMAHGGVRWASALRGLRLLARAAMPARRNQVAYRRIPGDRVTLFAAGMRRPAIYASTAAERALSPEAFRAALLHEQAHIRSHDTRWLALLALAEAGAAWAPSIRRAFADLRVQVEWQADQAALHAGAEREALFDAIVLAAAGTRWGAGLTGAGAGARLQWLTEPDASHDAAPGLGRALAGLLMPPALAHLLAWTGLICALCAQHLW